MCLRKISSVLVFHKYLPKTSNMRFSERKDDQKRKRDRGKYERNDRIDLIQKRLEGYAKRLRIREKTISIKLQNGS